MICMQMYVLGNIHISVNINEIHGVMYYLCSCMHTYIISDVLIHLYVPYAQSSNTT